MGPRLRGNVPPTDSDDLVIESDPSLGAGCGMRGAGCAEGIETPQTEEFRDDEKATLKETPNADQDPSMVSPRRAPIDQLTSDQKPLELVNSA
jgi:hypothetical protein